MTAHPRPWRLTVRLAWRLAAVMTAGVVLAAAGVAWRTFATINAVNEAALQDQADEIADDVTQGPNGQLLLNPSTEDKDEVAPTGSASIFLIEDATGRQVLASGPHVRAALQPMLANAGFFRLPPSAAYLDGLVGVAIAHGSWRVAVAQGRGQQQALIASLLDDFLVSTLWLLVPIGAATVGMGVFTLRLGLRPLREASAAARQVGPAAPGTRLPTAGLPMELAPLVGTVNAALDRLERALDAQLRFTGEAAHALRTPLAVLTARIDALPPEAAPAALRDDADRLARLVAQMLTIARLDSLPLDVSGPLDLRGVAAETVAALAPLAVQRGVDLALLGAARLPPVTGNPAGVATALANLIDNAIVHAPAGTAVEVEATAPATLRVLDRGPGVPETEREAVFHRFHSRRSGGAGLGLAIVAGVAAAHGGSAWVEPRDGGGAAFVLTLRPGEGRRATAGEHRADAILAMQQA